MSITGIGVDASSCIIDINEQGTAHPEHELLYSVTDSEASLILAHPKYESVITSVAKTANIELQLYGDDDMDVQEKSIPELFDMEITRSALIIFTSGTTGRHIQRGASKSWY